MNAFQQVFSLKPFGTRKCFGGLLLFLLLAASSCSLFSGKNDPEVVAKVFDKVLYLDDIKGIFPKGLSKEDSILYAKNYIDNWIRKNLTLHYAEKNLSEDQKNFDKMIEDYRNSLLTFNYEKELVRQKLDTFVDENQINKYYNEHQNDFLLKFNIIKVIYVKLPENAPDLRNVKKWMQSSDEKDWNKLDNYCKQNAINYYLDRESWLLFDDLIKEIPIKTYDQESYLQNHRFIEIQDSTSNYLLNIIGFKIKEQISPLSFEHDNIRQIILNKRKMELIRQKENDLYQEALKNNDFKIYNSK